METVRAALIASDFPMAAFHAESFGGPRATPSAPADERALAPAATAAPGNPGAVRPRRSSQLLGILPRPHLTVLADLPAAGVPPGLAIATGAAPTVADQRAPTAVLFSASGREARDCSGETILEAAEALGLPFPSACRSGVCGTCKTRKLSGHVSMDCEDGLDPGERSAGFILACTAHPLDRVIVEA
jgi:ferredoxin